MARRTLKKRKDGYFRAWACGKQFYGKTQKEAIHKAETYKAQIQMSMSKNAYDIMFLPYADRRIDTYYARANEASRNTYHSMMKFVDEHLTHHRMVDIDANELQSICDMLTVYSASYVHKFMIVLRNIFRSAHANGIRLTDPMDAVRAPEGLPVKGHRNLMEWERELVRSTWQEHAFGPAAMVMMYAGLRRGEMLYLNVDRDVDLKARTITVRGGVAYSEGNHNRPTVTEGKTDAAQRVIPLATPLLEVFLGRHGLLLPGKDGKLMTLAAFNCKYSSYIHFLEMKLNNRTGDQYGLTEEQFDQLPCDEGEPQWKKVTIRCHDFRKDFCTRGIENGISAKAMQTWMGHAGPDMINRVYTGITETQQATDAEKLMNIDK